MSIRRANDTPEEGSFSVAPELLKIPAEALMHVVPFLNDIDQDNMSLANKSMQEGVNRWYTFKFNTFAKERFHDELDWGAFKERVRAKSLSKIDGDAYTELLRRGPGRKMPISVRLIMGRKNVRTFMGTTIEEQKKRAAFKERIRAQVRYSGGRCLYRTALTTPLRTYVLQLQLQLLQLQLQQEDEARPQSCCLCPSGNKIAILLRRLIGPSSFLIRSPTSLLIFDFTTKEFVFMHQSRYLSYEAPPKGEWISDRKILTKIASGGVSFKVLELYTQEANNEWTCKRVPGEFYGECVRNSEEIFLAHERFGFGGMTSVAVSLFSTGDESLDEKFSIDLGHFRVAYLFIFVCDEKWLLISLSVDSGIGQEKKTHLYVYDIDTNQQACHQEVDFGANLVQAAGNSSVFFARCVDNSDNSDVTTLKVDENGSISTGFFSFRVRAHSGGFTTLAATKSHLLLRDSGTDTVHMLDQKTGKHCWSLNTGRNACMTVSSDQKELFVLDSAGTLNVFCLEELHD